MLTPLYEYEMKHCSSVAHCPLPGGGVSGSIPGWSGCGALAKASVGPNGSVAAARSGAADALFFSKISRPDIANKYMSTIVKMKTVVSLFIFTKIEDSTISRSGLWITPKRWNAKKSGE